MVRNEIPVTIFGYPITKNAFGTSTLRLIDTHRFHKPVRSHGDSTKRFLLPRVVLTGPVWYFQVEWRRFTFSWCGLVCGTLIKMGDQFDEDFCKAGSHVRIHVPGASHKRINFWWATFGRAHTIAGNYLTQRLICHLIDKQTDEWIRKRRTGNISHLLFRT